ncbi:MULTISPECIES: DUF2182 domain-containing protein [Marinobacter]|uniref:DUF2182 domain-containing protein n=1 Tax=Marinobacter suaedae TaxID=3057675 RepID=A0ABT8VX95_9GAMM|nr:MULTISPECIES: DUF2182 domain-containing protein [unclassified Marinobacter]MBZ2168706.1 DUF2182 domain-containing protein [Marinobacter sp. F4216]MDO3720584.1 DUF2182 domain-containing protein [Marinobacter sp. chi1]
MRARHGAFSGEWLRGSLLTLAGLLAIAALAWLYLIGMASDMEGMSSGSMIAFHHWTLGYFALMFVMWSIMMVAMMMPSAAPMVLLYRQVVRKNHLPAVRGTIAFTGGYVLVWALFSLAATLLQWLLEEWALLSPMMRSQSVLFSGALLMAAGIYQLSSFKQACLKRCRGPLLFITCYWQPGVKGAFTMGLRHGAFCVGCCGALMLLLFAGGVMDLTVIAAIAGVVLLEKLVPHGEWWGKTIGVLAIAFGLGLVVSG